MTDFVVRRIDPTPCQRIEALDEVFRAAAEREPYPWSGLNELGGEDGAYFWLLYVVETYRLLEVVAARWADPLGRRHWAFSAKAVLTDSDEGGWMCRWDDRADGPGWWGRLVGSSRAPRRSRRLDASRGALSLAPDGRLFLAAGYVAVHDPITLEEVARFEPSRAWISSAAFSPDGQVVALTDRGLAVWPWKELFG